MKQKRNHRVTIHTTVGGDINRTLRTETFDMTEAEYDRFLRSDPRWLPSWIYDLRSNEAAQGGRP